MIINLRRVLEQPVLGLNEKERDKIRNLIRGGGRWIVDRVDSKGMIRGDEKRESAKLIYTTWGLLALIETYDTQEEKIRKEILPIIGAYIREIDDRLSKESVSLGQEYLTILSPTVDEPLYYEDRSDWGGILLTLISIRKITGIDNFLDATPYKRILDAVYNGILQLRNNSTKLWYKDKFILSIHSYLVEAFIEYEKYGRDFGLELNVTSAMLHNAIKQALIDDSVLGIVHQKVYTSLSRTMRDKEQKNIFDKEIKKEQ